MRVPPAHLWCPENVGTRGDEAADLASSIGIALDAEQRLALDLMYAEKADGQLAAFEFCEVLARQNGKSAVLQVAALTDLFVTGDDLIVWTAHQFSTTQEAFLGIKSLVENYDHLRRRCKKPRTANGDEGIETLTGKRLNFRARAQGAGRGLSGDKVILDEAFKLSGATVGDLLPTTAARPNSQIRYASSAGRLESAHLRSLRDRGRAGGDASLAYLEWCAPDRECASDECDHLPSATGCALDHVDLWQAANPALGIRIPIERVAAFRRSMPPEEFAREFLSWWSDPPSESGEVITPEAWDPIADTDPGHLEPVAFGLTVAPDRSRSSIGVAARRTDGRVQVELAEERPGTRWIPEWLAERTTTLTPVAVVLDGTAQPLLADLEEAGVKNIIATSSTTRARASVALYDAIAGDQLRHGGGSRLTRAAMAAVKKPMADGWLWEGSGVGPLQAVTLAHAGLTVHGAVIPPPPAPLSVSTEVADAGGYSPLGVDFGGGGINF